jgi:hypothetical protein
MASLDDLENALAAFAIEAGFPRNRRLLAGALLSIGVSPAGVELLGRHCEAHVEGQVNAVKVLYSQLAGPPDALKARIADLESCEAARSRRDATVEFGKAQRQQPSDEDLAQRLAFARVVADRAPLPIVAAEMGLPPAEVERLVELERAARARNAAAPAAAARRDTPAEAARRREEVRSALFDRRQPKRRGETTVFDVLRKTAVATGWLLEELRNSHDAKLGHGFIDLRRMLRDPVRRGAFAQMENAGEIQPCGDPDLTTGLAPFRVVTDEAQRAAIVEQRRNWIAAEVGTIGARMQAAKAEGGAA